jgi:hypothetical protein
MAYFLEICRDWSLDFEPRPYLVLQQGLGVAVQIFEVEPSSVVVTTSTINIIYDNIVFQLPVLNVPHSIDDRIGSHLCG